MLWTEYRYRDVVSNGLLFLTSYMDEFVCVILTGLVFRLLLDADPKYAKIPQIRIEIYVWSVEGQRYSEEKDAGSWQNQGYGPSSKLEIGL